MARWVNIKGASAPTGMSMTLDYDSHGSTGQFYQDEKPFLEQAKMDREMVTKENKLGAKKFATIPDIVAIEINEKYGIDLHDPATGADAEKMKRFKYIVSTQYPYLLSF